jgi:PAS domain S-box-containing protein/putative nucleotidyltransferase with HDIG domain
MKSEAINILLIEDNPDDARFVKELLSESKQASSHLDIADRLSQGIACVKKNHYDVVLLDLGLPDSKGLNTFIKLHTEFNHLPIVVLSGLDDESVSLASVQEGAQDYLIKGKFDRHILWRSIRYAIERKRAEVMLRKSEEKYHTIADFTRDWEYWLSPEGSFIYVSPSCKFHTGYDSEAFQQDPDMMLKVIHPDDRDIYARHQKEALATDKRSKPLDFRIITRDGEERWIGHRCQKVYGPDGKYLGTRGSNRDITDRKSAEQALLERFKELTCLYGVSSLADIQDVSLDELLKRMVMLIPPGWQYSEVAEACIALEGRNFPTARFRETSWMLAGEIKVAGKTVGQVKVCYLEERPAGDDGPFLKEERRLIDEIALRLGKIISSIRSEDALKESEKKHRAVVEMASDVIVIIQEGIIRFANPRVTTMFGYETGEIEGREFVSFIPPENLGLALERYRKRMVGEKLSEIYETELLHKSGRRIPVETSGGVIEYAGKPADLAIIRDITERKQAEEAIKESEERYRTLFETSAEGILIADLETRQFQYANPAICRMLGYPEEELRTMDVAAIHPKGDWQRVLAEFEAQARGDIILASELPCLRKDGTIIYADVNAVGITIAGRRFNAGFFRDITERKLSAERLLKSYESVAKTLNDAINTMVKIVELRDPYTSGHQQKVADLATAIAREMKLEDTRIDQLRTAAMIHDIGKMYVPSDILSKPGRLSEIELSLIKTHSQSGYDIVKGMDFPGIVAEAVLQHHERLDGSGYPNGLKGEDTLLEAKILIVADVIEAMASHRPYRQALGIDKALEEISRNRGKIYEPDVVDACLELFNSGRFEFK